MGKTEHTPGPWQVMGPTRADDPRWYVMRYSGVEDVPPEKFYIAIMSCGNLVRDEADARRIIACVNACEGIPTVELLQAPNADPRAILDVILAETNANAP